MSYGIFVLMHSLHTENKVSCSKLFCYGQSMIFQHMRTYLACSMCGEKIFAIWLKHVRKMCYSGHRRFLPQYHPYRRQKRHLMAYTSMGLPQSPWMDMKFWIKLISSAVVGGKERSQTKTEQIMYWEHLHIGHVLHVIHIEKNVCKSVIGTLLNISGKTTDGITSIMDFVEMGVRCE